MKLVIKDRLDMDYFTDNWKLELIKYNIKVIVYVRITVYWPKCKRRWILKKKKSKQ